jgi:hypothetical protein
MATVSESATSKTQLASGLAQGVETLSLNQEINFTLYVKLVLPLDGYVFWVNASLLTDNAIYNISQYNKLLYNEDKPIIPAREFKAQGSFHLSQEVHQMSDTNVVYNHVTFTSLHPIKNLSAINPQFIYVGDFDGIRFAFSRRDNFYKQADLYHYRGDALYSMMRTQLIDTMTGFDTTSPIVSNSLPIWLSLNQFFPMYPSYLTPLNESPIYGAVDIIPSETTALGQFPIVRNVIPTSGSPTQSSSYQLTSDTVKIPIFGIRNQEAINFANYVYQYSMNTDNIGLMNMPIIQDEKIAQPEFGIIAMKKTITFKVSYYQNTVNDVALKYIQSAFCSLTPTTV